MQRVAVIGNAGGGKSTLSRALANKYALPLHSVDQLQWAPGWTPRPAAVLTSALDALLREDRWLIDGWGPWPTLERRLMAADTIVLVDHPLWIHFWWAAERQIACARGEKRPDAPAGCDMLDVTERLFETIWDIDQKLMPKLRELVSAMEGDHQVHRITSPDALDEFIAKL